MSKLLTVCILGFVTLRNDGRFTTNMHVAGTRYEVSYTIMI